MDVIKILGIVAAIFWILGLLQVFRFCGRLSGKLKKGSKLLLLSAFLNFVIVVLFLLADYNIISTFYNGLIIRILLIFSAIIFTFGIKRLISILDYIPDSLTHVLAETRNNLKFNNNLKSKNDLKPKNNSKSKNVLTKKDKY